MSNEGKSHGRTGENPGGTGKAIGGTGRSLAGTGGPSGGAGKNLAGTSGPSGGAGKNLDETLAACGELIGILKRLRAPDGCPWDRKQTEESMAPLILEEAFELADAVAAGHAGKTAEEMGDLFMNTFMTALIAEEKGRFTLKEVFEKISAKLIGRHPHVFGEGKAKTVEDILHKWEDIKRSERVAEGDDASAVAGVPRAMPGLLRAFRVAEKIGRTGADLPPFRDPLGRAAAALERFRAAEKAGGGSPAGSRSGPRGGGAENSRSDAGALLGKILLSLCNGASLAKVNPEMALRAAVEREEAAFRRVEAALGPRLAAAPPEEVDRAWNDRGEGGGKG